MRQIKFRAWDNKKNEMVFFDFNSMGGWDAGEVYIGKEMEDYVSNPKYEMMHYSGFDDEDEKNIYEDDIVTGSYYDEYKEEKYIRGKVEFKYGRFELFCSTENHFWLNDIHDLRVTGNIHQNPKLLTK